MFNLLSLTRNSHFNKFLQDINHNVTRGKKVPKSEKSRKAPTEEKLSWKTGMRNKTFKKANSKVYLM